MRLSLLLTIAATSTSLPAASAILNPVDDQDADAAAGDLVPTFLMIPTDGGASDGKDADPAAPGDKVATIATLMVSNNEGETLPVEAAVTTSMVPIDGDNSTIHGEVSITTANGKQPLDTVQTVPELYQDSYFVGPTWTATKYYNATKGELVYVAKGSVITLEFEEDGRFDGHSGCNHYFGGYAPSSASVASVARSSANSNHLAESSFAVVGPLGSTMMWCDAALMDQERTYSANLNGEIDYSISQDGSVLVMKDSETGIVVAEYSLFAPLLLDRTWAAIQYYNSTSDELVDVISGSNITLRMETDERLDGDAGCNRYIGSYDDLTPTSFAIAGDVGSTKMLCKLQDGVTEQEELYLKNFEDGRVVTWSVLDDGSLELRDSGTDSVIARYTSTADLKLTGNSPPSSGATAIGTSVAAFAIMTVMVAW